MVSIYVAGGAGRGWPPEPGVAVTVRFNVADWRIPPPLPVMVIGYDPAEVPLPTLIVTVELPAPGAGMGFGVKLMVVPAGTPKAERAIELLKPPLIAVARLAAP